MGGGGGHHCRHATPVHHTLQLHVPGGRRPGWVAPLVQIAEHARQEHLHARGQLLGAAAALGRGRSVSRRMAHTPSMENSGLCTAGMPQGGSMVCTRRRWRCGRAYRRSTSPTMEHSRSVMSTCRMVSVLGRRASSASAATSLTAKADGRDRAPSTTASAQDTRSVCNVGSDRRKPSAPRRQRRGDALQTEGRQQGAPRHRGIVHGDVHRRRSPLSPGPGAGRSGRRDPPRPGGPGRCFPTPVGAAHRAKRRRGAATAGQHRRLGCPGRAVPGGEHAPGRIRGSRTGHSTTTSTLRSPSGRHSSSKPRASGSPQRTRSSQRPTTPSLGAPRTT